MTLVTSDQFASEEEFITRMWAAPGTKGNDEGPGFMKDRNWSSPGEAASSITRMNGLLQQFSALC